MIELTKEQKSAHDGVIDWCDSALQGKECNDHISLSGLAGTGKTTLTSFISDTLHKNLCNSIAFCAFTGKASMVLKTKLKDCLHEDDYVGTIHSLIYRPVIDPNSGKIIGWSKREEIDFDLIIVDEASMVNKDLWKDLVSYRVPIVAVGDHGQLPPIGSTNFSLMENPDIVLEKIHRQAENNPIIKLSIMAREEGWIEQGMYGKSVACMDWVNPVAKKCLNTYKPSKNSQILCGMNKTRVDINRRIRKNMGIDDPNPQNGEKIICLMNNKDNFIMNGQTGYIKDIKFFSDYTYEMTTNMDNSEFDTFSLSPKFSWNMPKIDDLYGKLIDPKIKLDRASSGRPVDVFDFGYCITGWKAQGSEWDKVVFIEEYNSHQTDEERARFLYTCITRARKKLLIIQDYY